MYYEYNESYGRKYIVYTPDPHPPAGIWSGRGREGQIDIVDTGTKSEVGNTCTHELTVTTVWGSTQ